MTLDYIFYKLHRLYRMYSFFKDIYLFIYFREKRREGESVLEKHWCVVASHAPSTGDLACNPGMCPDWESKQQPFGFQACIQSTDPHQPGLFIHILNEYEFFSGIHD